MLASRDCLIVVTNMMGPDFTNAMLGEDRHCHSPSVPHWLAVWLVRQHFKGLESLM